MEKAGTTEATPVKQNTPPQSSLSSKAIQYGYTEEILEARLHQQFIEYGFTDKGFKGWAKFTNNMVLIRSDLEEDIIKTVAK